MLVYDIETDGLLDTVTRTHVVVIHELDDKLELVGKTRYGGPNGNPPISEAMARLAEADWIAGHNIVDFDNRVNARLFPGWKTGAKILDTLLAAKVVWPNIRDIDFRRLDSHPEFPRNLIGRHSLEAWGHRIGEYKGDFKGPWDEWTQEMEDYCDQDVSVTVALVRLIFRKVGGIEAFTLAASVRGILTRQEEFGFRFDEAGAQRLVAKLARRRAEVAAELAKVFHPFYLPDGTKVFVPKADSRRYGYTAGAPICKIKRVEFNPGSGDHIAHRLTALYGWRPKAFTPDGKPQTDEAVLSKLSYPPIKLLLEYALLSKRLGQIAEGQEAWLKWSKDGVVHGRVDGDGAITGRMTHSKPNVAQVPANYSEYGEESRELWGPPPGMDQVGCDADGLELRCLAHYMARWDGGEFAKAVAEGRKEDGSDAHTINQKAVGLNERDSAKTLIYALIYGAGDLKLGKIIWEDMTEEQRKEFGKVSDGKLTNLGRVGRANLMKRLPALKKFVNAVKEAAKKGWLKGLDGRRIPVRAIHSAPNAKLQSDGGIIMKRALVILDETLQSIGLVPGQDYEFMANIHDEWQIASLPQHSELAGRTAAAAIKRAGEYYRYRIPLAGSYAIGRSWKETH